MTTSPATELTTTPKRIRPTFPLGRTVATPGALAALEAAGEPPLRYLTLHAQGDTGTLDPEDSAANDRARENGSRIFSAYETALGTRLWVITEADRSSTTILLPEEY